MEKDIAILMSKVVTPAGDIIFLPVQVVEGKNNIDFFTTVTGIEYAFMEDKSLVYSEISYCVANSISEISLRDMYPEPTFLREEIIGKYYEDYIRTIYIMPKEQIEDQTLTLKEICLEDNDNIDLSSLKSVSKEEKLKVENLKALRDTLKNSGKESPENKEKNIYVNSFFSQSFEEVYQSITSSIIGQDDPALRLLSEMCKKEVMAGLDVEDDQGILITGPTGVGKTALLKSISKYLNRSFMIVDTTQLTMPGYVGESIEDYLNSLYIFNKKDKEKTEKSIIVFDEIDKKRSQSNQDVSGKGVLNTLLKFLDGTSYRIKAGVEIATDKMIVLAAGAFMDLYDEKGKIGYCVENQKNIRDISDKLLNDSGTPSELIGRLPIRIALNSLTEEDLKKILLESTISPLKKQIEIFKALGTSLSWTPSYIDALVKEAYKRETGARALNEMIALSTWYPMGTIFKQRTSEIILTERALKEPTSPKAYILK